MVENGLYVVATPIGNLADMVPRAVEILRAVDLIAAEDTRHSRPLLQHFGIATRMRSCHEYSTPAEIDTLLLRLQTGSVAMITDAGTPLISDPGRRLVEQALAAGIPVTPVPGPSALTAALSVAGLPAERFVFEGFLPARAHGRRRRLAELAGETRTLVLFESPHRLRACLADLAAAFGPERSAVLARELTKLHETLRRAPLGKLRDWVEADAEQCRGESVLVVAGAVPADAAVSEESLRVLSLLLEDLPPSRAVALAAKITGAPRQALYRRLAKE